MNPPTEHRARFKVYYEDTDSLGVVYYANYLKYLERGRTEYVGDVSGRDIRRWNEDGFNFVVYALNMKFKKSAELGDIIEVVTLVQNASLYRSIFKQRIERAGDLIIEAEVEVVCFDKARNICEFPALTRG